MTFGEFGEIPRDWIPVWRQVNEHVVHHITERRSCVGTRCGIDIQEATGLAWKFTWVPVDRINCLLCIVEHG